MPSSAADLPAAAAADELIGALDDSRRRFLALVEPIRPELHRYCTRMTGSAADGEDVVQDTLAAACFELAQLRALPPLRPWLFRIAHNRAIDHWRRESVRRAEPIDEAAELRDEPLHEPDALLARRQAVRAALSAFLELPPLQRACVVLKDVLEHSLEEIAATLDIGIPAAKSALHRGRATLARVAVPAHAAPRALSPALVRYAQLFNAHDWDAVRSQLADDVRLDLVSRRKLNGRAAVGSYFSNYEQAPGWHLRPAWLDGREVLVVLPSAQAPAQQARYVITLQWRAGQINAIRDFRYVGYIVHDRVPEFDACTDDRRPG